MSAVSGDNAGLEPDSTEYCAVGCVKVAGSSPSSTQFCHALSVATMPLCALSQMSLMESKLTVPPPKRSVTVGAR